MAIELTSPQWRIVRADQPVVLVEAVAGAGKTTTLAHVIRRRIELGVVPERMLVLVFSPGARRAFLQRLREAGVRESVNVITFGDFAAQALKRLEDAGVTDPAEWLATEEQARPTVLAAVARAYAQAAARRHADDGYDYDQTNASVEQTLSLLGHLKGTLQMRRFWQESDRDLAEALDWPAGQVAVCRHYEMLRGADDGYPQFRLEQDLVYDLVEVLRRAPERRTLLPDFEMVIVDEWHDVNAAQVELLQGLLTPKTQLIAMGDRDQVVNAWHGADPRFMGEYFDLAFPGATRLPLPNSFRFGPTLAESMARVINRGCESQLVRDTAIDTVNYGQDGCAAKLATQLADWKKTRWHRWDDCAILVRDIHQTIAIENALLQARIPYQMTGISSYFERDEIRMLRGLLHILLRNFDTVGSQQERRAIVRALSLYAGFGLGSEKRAQAEEQVASFPDFLHTYFLKRLTADDDPDEKLPDAARRWRLRFAEVLNELEPRAAKATAAELLQQAAQALRLEDATSRLFVRRDYARAVAASLRGFIQLPAAAKHKGADFLAWLEASDAKRRQSTARSGNAVSLTSIHYAKGNEWPLVLLPYLQVGEFPARNGDPAEERRLFYVAASRARERLCLLVPDPKQPEVARPSPLVAAMQLAETRRHGTKQLRRNQAERPQARDRLVYLDVPKSDEFAARNLGAVWDGYRGCYYVPEHVMDIAPLQRWVPREEQD